MPNRWHAKVLATQNVGKMLPIFFKIKKRSSQTLETNQVVAKILVVNYSGPKLEILARH
jgi:hypothetical protein